MKLQITFSGSARGRPPASRNGFTLPEILIALTVFLFMLAGIVSANLFGLRMFQFNSTKLTATDWSRRTFGKITDEVHSCNAVQVGNVVNGVFEALLDGQTQQGTGLLIYPTTNTTSYIIYFVNPADQTFRRTTDQPGTAVILADSITNSMVFSAQDFSGSVLTNSQNNSLIHLVLEFYQAGLMMSDPDYSKLETSVARRAVK